MDETMTLRMKFSRKGDTGELKGTYKVGDAHHFISQVQGGLEWYTPPGGR
jgi:hypothetical protein